MTTTFDELYNAVIAAREAAKAPGKEADEAIAAAARAWRALGSPEILVEDVQVLTGGSEDEFVEILRVRRVVANETGDPVFTSKRTGTVGRVLTAPFTLYAHGRGEVRYHNAVGYHGNRFFLDQVIRLLEERFAAG